MHKIVTCDEKWILYDNPKRQKLWLTAHRPGEPSTSIAKPNIHAKKVLLCIWWDQKGVIHYELLQQNQTMTAELYQEQLIRVNDALEEKRPFAGSERRKVILLQDNAWSRTVKNTLETIFDLGWEILPHAAYSPDLAPSDYHLFRALQHHLTDSRFKSDEEVEKSLDEFINSKPPSFFRSGIRQLPERWKKCIDSEGDYFEDRLYSRFYK